MQRLFMLSGGGSKTRPPPANPSWNPPINVTETSSATQLGKDPRDAVRANRRRRHRRGHHHRRHRGSKHHRRYSTSSSCSSSSSSESTFSDSTSSDFSLSEAGSTPSVTSMSAAAACDSLDRPKHRGMRRCGRRHRSADRPKSQFHSKANPISISVGLQRFVIPAVVVGTAAFQNSKLGAALNALPEPSATGEDPKTYAPLVLNKWVSVLKVSESELTIVFQQDMETIARARNKITTDGGSPAAVLGTHAAAESAEVVARTALRASDDPAAITVRQVTLLLEHLLDRRPLEVASFAEMAFDYIQLVAAAALWGFDRQLVQLPFRLWTATRWSDLTGVYAQSRADQRVLAMSPVALQLDDGSIQGVRLMTRLRVSTSTVPQGASGVPGLGEHMRKERLLELLEDVLPGGGTLAAWKTVLAVFEHGSYMLVLLHVPKNSAAPVSLVEPPASRPTVAGTAASGSMWPATTPGSARSRGATGSLWGTSPLNTESTRAGGSQTAGPPPGATNNRESANASFVPRWDIHAFPCSSRYGALSQQYWAQQWQRGATTVPSANQILIRLPCSPNKTVAFDLPAEETIPIPNGIDLPLFYRRGDKHIFYLAPRFVLEVQQLVDLPSGLSKLRCGKSRLGAKTSMSAATEPPPASGGLGGGLPAGSGSMFGLFKSNSSSNSHAAPGSSVSVGTGTGAVNFSASDLGRESSRMVVSSDVISPTSITAQVAGESAASWPRASAVAAPLINSSATSSGPQQQLQQQSQPQHMVLQSGWQCHHPTLGAAYSSQSLKASKDSLSGEARCVKFFPWGALITGDLNPDSHSYYSSSYCVAVLSVDHPDLRSSHGDKFSVMVKLPNHNVRLPHFDVTVTPGLERVYICCCSQIASTTVVPGNPRIDFNLSFDASKRLRLRLCHLDIPEGAPSDSSFGFLHCAGMLATFEPSLGIYYQNELCQYFCTRYHPRLERSAATMIHGRENSKVVNGTDSPAAASLEAECNKKWLSPDTTTAPEGLEALSITSLAESEADESASMDSRHRLRSPQANMSCENEAKTSLDGRKNPNPLSPSRVPQTPQNSFE